MPSLPGTPDYPGQPGALSIQETALVIVGQSTQPVPGILEFQRRAVA